MSGSCLGRLSAHFSQHDDRSRGTSTSPAKNRAPAQAESNLGSWT